MTDGAVAEKKMCRCGLPMLMSRRQPDVGMCANCDGIQPQEKEYDPATADEDGNMTAYERQKTPWDKKYENETNRLAREEWYPEQFKGKKGGAQ